MTETETFYGDRLTEHEEATLERIKQENICLVRCTLNGIQRAAICEAYEDEDGCIMLFPFALVMTDDEIRTAIDPNGQPTIQDDDHVVS